MPTLDIQTTICNGAIDLIGAAIEDCEKLTVYESDTGPTADWFRENYDRCRKRALLQHDWDEAVVFLPGTDAGGDVDDIDHDPYLYAYAIPTTYTLGGDTWGVLALRNVVDANGDAVDYEVSRGHIHCDAATSDFRWKLLLDLESGFSQSLQDAIEYELAIRAAAKILKGDRGDKKRRTLLDEYRNLILPLAKGQSQSKQYDRHNQTRQDRVIDIT